MKFYPGSARKSKWPSAPYAPDNPQTNAPAMKPPAAMGTVPSQADTNRPKRKENHTTNQRRKANNERHHREQKQDGAPLKTHKNDPLGEFIQDFMGDVTGERQGNFLSRLDSHNSRVIEFNKKASDFDPNSSTRLDLFNLKSDYNDLQVESQQLGKEEKHLYSSGMYALLGYDKVKNPQHPTQKSQFYPFYEGAKEKADWWDQNIVSKVDSLLRKSPVLPGHEFSHKYEIEFIKGVTKSPAVLTEIAGMLPAGIERSSKVAGDLPGYVLAGLGLQAQTLYKGSTERPAEFAGELAGLGLITKGIRGGMGRTGRLVRTTGKTYIPVTDIGFDVNHGYPLGKPTTHSLHKSFTESKLVPPPLRMGGTLNTNVPHTVKTSRLPTDTPGIPQMWTAWENRMKPDVPLGKKATIGGGSSEIGGMYGAPAALTYFTKAGGQSPKFIGFDFPSIKSPSLLRTTVKTFEPIPENLSRQTTNLKAHGASNKQAYKGINDYLNTNAETGKAYFPNTKAEYEAVLPEGNIVEFKGSQFYTKVRGGRRVPIYEFEAIGKTKSGIKDSGLRRFSSKKGSSGSEVFEPAPYISGFNTLSSTIASSCSSFHYPERSLAAFLSEIGSSKTGSSETGSSKTGSSKTGSSKTGSSKTGSSKTGSSKTGSSKTGSSKTGSSKTGSSETGSSETGSSETGSSETGSSETGSSEISYGNSYSAFISRGIGKHPSKIRLQQRQKAKAIKMMTKKTKKDWYVKNPVPSVIFGKPPKLKIKIPKTPTIKLPRIKL